jgi:anti-sigma B factor antagonist
MSNGLSMERRSTSLGPTWVMSGELDVASAGTAEAVLTAEVDSVPGHVRLDLSELDFMGFAGADLLVALAHRIAAEGRQLLVVATNPQIDRVLEIVGITLAPADDTGFPFVPPGRTSRVPGSDGRPTRDTTRPATPVAGRCPRSDGGDHHVVGRVAHTVGHGADVVVDGDLDILTVGALRTALADAAAYGDHVTVDLAAVDFIDSAGLHIMLEAERTVRATGRRLSVTNPSAPVRRLLELTSLLDHFGLDAPPAA